MVKVLLLVSILFSQIAILFPVRASTNITLSINEFMPNPVGSDTDYEWIELYNSSEAALNLNQFKLNGRLLPNYNLEPDSYIVVAKNTSKLTELFPDIESVQIDFSLVNSGGTIRLESGSFIDEVVYPNSAEGISFERVSLSCGNLIKHIDSNTIGYENSKLNNFCEIGFEVTKITNEINLSEFYGNSISLKTSPETQVEWFINNEFSSSGSTIQLDNLEIGNYLLTAKNSSFTAEKEISIYPKILFSEVMADPEGTDTGNEWIEIFTDGYDDLNGWYIEDSSGKEFLTETSGDYPIFTIHHISLNNSSETLKLFTPDGLLSDSISYSVTHEGISLSRFSSDWKEEENTPGEQNREKFLQKLSLLEARDSQETILIEGMVTEAQNLLSDYFFIQDDISGLKIKNETDFKPTLGEKLEIKGHMRSTFEFVAEEIKILNPQTALTVHKISDLTEDKIGMLGYFEGQISKISGSTFFISSNNQEIKITILKSSDISLKKKTGDFIKITGIIDGVKNGDSINLRVLPRDKNDIEIQSSTVKTKTPKKSTVKSTLDELEVELNLQTPLNNNHYQISSDKNNLIEYLIANIGIISVGVIRLVITKFV